MIEKAHLVDGLDIRIDGGSIERLPGARADVNLDGVGLDALITLNAYFGDYRSGGLGPRYGNAAQQGRQDPDKTGIARARPLLTDFYRLHQSTPKRLTLTNRFRQVNLRSAALRQLSWTYPQGARVLSEAARVLRGFHEELAVAQS
jgi:hypothetical protein